ncbi:hypothetical protein [Alcanivorax sp.]|uniref:hypothetical protein n=1 Tax=Alcanivorax sp. TaxID=1872427 RepID=UPI003A9354CC
MSDTPETIYLIPDYDEGVLGHVWCDDPAPGLGMKPEDAIEYRRADVVEAALAKQAKAAKNGMDAAHKASSQKLKAARRLRNESRPEMIESERQANAQLTAQIEYLEQLAADRLAQNTLDAERIAELEKALEPFALEGAQWGELLADCHPALKVDCRYAGLSAFTVGDLRRAAALLKDS